MYSYIVGKNSDREKLVFDACHYRSFQRLGQKNKRTPPITPLLCVSRQVREEALDVLYQQNTFYVLLSEYSHTFDVVSYNKIRVYDRDVPVMPYGWDVERIAHLCIGIDLYQGYTIDTPSTLASIDWGVLPLMTKLRTLRFYIGTRSRGNSYSTYGETPVHNEYIDGNGDLPNGTIWYRQMMRDLIALTPKDVDVSFGLDDMEEQLKYYEREHLETEYVDGPIPPQFVVGDFLEKTFKEFEALRGVDVACYKSVPVTF